jgi:hypothetical protein
MILGSLGSITFGISGGSTWLAVLTSDVTSVCRSVRLHGGTHTSHHQKAHCLLKAIREASLNARERRLLIGMLVGTVGSGTIHSELTEDLFMIKISFYLNLTSG